MTSPWILAARPRTLPASVAPVLVGTALAVREGAFDSLVFFATLLAALLLQIGANYANDVFDFLKGADQNRQGPLRVTQSGLLTPQQMLIGTAVVFGLAALVGLWLVRIGGVPILVIGLLAITAALAYTAGPLPLAYRGLGEVAAFVFSGWSPSAARITFKPARSRWQARWRASHKLRLLPPFSSSTICATLILTAPQASARLRCALASVSRAPNTPR